MILKFDSLGNAEEREVDLMELVDRYDITDAEALYSAILMTVSHHTMLAGCKPSEAWANSIEYEGHVIDPPSGDVWEEIAHLVMWVIGHTDEWDYLPIFAVIANGWRYTDFDQLDDLKDNHMHTIDASTTLGEWAREWMYEVGEGIPDHLESYFDYEEYGEALKGDYDVHEYEGDEYLFSK